jgi:arylsulfatase A-like enzyme
MLALLLFLSWALNCVSAKSPNVLLIVVDDVGNADLGFSAGSMPTPYLDSLARRGVILDNYYTHPVCTPSRAALLTGRYSHNVGLVGPLLGTSLCSLPNDTSTLAEELRARGYATHLVGKWHLGHAKWSSTPLERGFDTHFGIFGAATDHYEKFVWSFYDFRRQRAGFYDEAKIHSSKILENETISILRQHAHFNSKQPFFLMLSFLAAHAPLQADPDHLAPCADIVHTKRRMFCGLIQSIEMSTKRVMSELEALGFADDTLVVFTTDNGGMPHEGGLPYPFRGAKLSTFEGGSRGPAFMLTPKGWLNRSGYRYKGLMHISDWFPTILHLVDNQPHLRHKQDGDSFLNGDVEKKAIMRDHKSKPLSASTNNKQPRLIGSRVENGVNYELDGLNLWEALSNNDASPRSDVVVSIDIFMNEASYRAGKWKIIMGDPHDGDWYKEPKKWVAETPSLFDKFFETFELVVMYIRGATTAYVLQEAINELRIAANHRFGYHLGPLESRSATPMPNGTWLFDIENDPEERRNLYHEHPEIAASLIERVNQIKDSLPTQCNWHLSDVNGLRNGKTPADPRWPNKLFQGPWIEEGTDERSVPTRNVFRILKIRARVVLLATLLGAGLAITLLIFLGRKFLAFSHSKLKKE